MFTVLSTLLSKCGACFWWCLLGNLQTNKDLMVRWHTAMIAADYLCHCRDLTYVCDATFWGKNRHFCFIERFFVVSAINPSFSPLKLVISSYATCQK